MLQIRFTPDAVSGPCPMRPAGRPRRVLKQSDHRQTTALPNPARRPKSRVLPQARISQTTL